jgi:hypothetical protein
MTVAVVDQLDMASRQRRIDPGIRRIVELLCSNGVETFESCEGGRGHPFPEPTVRFHGQYDEGWRALAIALQHGQKVRELRRSYDIIDGEPVGPYWEMVFTIEKRRRQ